MTTPGAWAWLFVGVGLLLWPPYRPRVLRPTRSAALSRRGLQVITSTAVAAAAVGVAGPVVGLAVAAVVAPVCVVAIRRLDARPARAAPDRRLALALDLAAASLRCGGTVPAALNLGAPAAGDAAAAGLRQVAGLLRLGADPPEAWRSVADDAVLAPVGQAAARSAYSGGRLAGCLEQAAADLRAQLRARAEARAHRAAVLAMLPLGLCFLPAFVCLGVVPVVVGIARGAFLGLP